MNRTRYCRDEFALREPCFPSHCTLFKAVRRKRFVRVAAGPSTIQAAARGASTLQEQVVPGSDTSASTASSTKNGRITSSGRSQPHHGSTSELDAARVNGASSQQRSADLLEQRRAGQDTTTHGGSDGAPQLRDPTINIATAEEAAAAERRRSGAEAGSSQVEVTQPAGPGRTVRLIRGPGGRMIRAPLAVDSGDAPVLPRNSALRTNADADGPRKTVRLVKGPGGQMMDASKVAGWVVLPDGQRTVCPRCQGAAFIRLNSKLELCPVCQGWRREGGEAPPGGVSLLDADMDGMDLRAGRGRSRRGTGRRGPLSNEHKEKIRASMSGRKRRPLTEAHKQRISDSMRAVHQMGITREQISETSRGRPKTCALCGKTGHNKRTCPQNPATQVSAKRVTRTGYARPEGAPTFRGVTWAASNGSWRAQAWDGNKVQLVGFFDDPEEAARAYDRAAIEYRGDKAVTNFPRESYAAESALQEQVKPEEDAALEVPVLEHASKEVSAEAPTIAAAAKSNFTQIDAQQAQERSAADRLADKQSEAELPVQAKVAVQEGTRPETAQPSPGNATESAFPKQAAAVSAESRTAARTRAAEGTPPSAAAPPRNASGAKTALKQVAAKAPPVVYPLPMTREEAVQSAVEGILRAWKAGKRRLRVELLLPEDGSSPFEGDGWPGGVKQQFAAVRPMVEATLMQLKQLPEFRGRLEARWLDESDCVGAWQSESMAAVVLPTAYTLDALRAIDADRGGQRLMLVFNPQWQTDGQIVSDFGFGKSKQEAEDFVGSFEDAAVTRRLRIMGDDVRLFRCFPSDWQVHFIWANGQGALLAGVEKVRPSYERLLELLRSVPGSKASRSWVDRVNPFNRLGLGGSASIEELLAAREAAERRLRASQTGLRPPIAATGSRMPALGSGLLEEARASSSAAPDQARLERAGAADRFGEVDIITGRPVRDLKLDPVLQLAQWQRSFFGSRDVSVDADESDAST
ncbi:probable APETALA2-like protein 2 at N-terminal half [Coccomyxa sp. Obi]|nr:probable APETALA2-like protein 2 at N-terminal half [Coccomyxa sp. Obi]